MTGDASDAPEAPGPVTRPKKRNALLVILGVLVLLVGGAIAADNWVRAQVADFAADKVEELLSLDEDQPVTIEIGGFSVLAQVLTGRLETVAAGVDDVRIGELSGDVRLEADEVPVDLEQPIDEVRIRFDVPESTVRAVAQTLTLSAVKSVELADGEIQLGTGFTILGAEFDVGVGLTPFAADGQVGFTPTTVEFQGERTSTAELIDRYGPIAEALFDTHDLCIARWLPQALRVDTVAVEGESLVIVIAADKRVFDDAALRSPGSCPSD